MNTAIDAALADWLPAFLARQRWFGAKGRAVAHAEVEDLADLEPHGRTMLALCGVAYEDGARERYLLLLARRRNPEGSPVLGRLGPPDGEWIVEAAGDAEALLILLRGFDTRRPVIFRSAGHLEFHDVSDRAARVFGGTVPPVTSIGAEQSNSSVRVGRDFMFKFFRRIEPGENPEVEISRFLTTHSVFRAAPPLDGAAVYRPPAGESSTVGVLLGWIESEGDGWTYILRALADALRSNATSDRLRGDLVTLGRTTAEFHAALAAEDSAGAFGCELVSGGDVDAWSAAIRDQTARTLALAASNLPAWSVEDRRLGQTLMSSTVRGAASAAAAPLTAGTFSKIRIHGDYHLGQTLKTTSGFTLIDFEGEPMKPLILRRQRTCALKDVAGMLRSFEYAIETAAGQDPVRADRLRAMADLRAPFLEGYFDYSSGLDSAWLPRDRSEVGRALRAFEFEKALYELEYEINNRPTWVGIPLRGILSLVEHPSRPTL